MNGPQSSPPKPLPSTAAPIEGDAGQAESAPVSSPEEPVRTWSQDDCDLEPNSEGTIPESGGGRTWGQDDRNLEPDEDEAGP